MVDELMTVIAKKLNKEATIRELKQYQIAEYLDIAPTALSNFYNGKRGLSIEKIADLALLFGKPIDYFFPETNDEEFSIDIDKISDDDVKLLSDIVSIFENHCNKGNTETKEVTDAADDY